jgi:hypothetical protein
MSVGAEVNIHDPGSLKVVRVVMGGSPPNSSNRQYIG